MLCCTGRRGTGEVEAGGSNCGAGVPLVMYDFLEARHERRHIHHDDRGCGGRGGETSYRAAVSLIKDARTFRIGQNAYHVKMAQTVN